MTLYVFKLSMGKIKLLCVEQSGVLHLPLCRLLRYQFQLPGSSTHHEIQLSHVETPFPLLSSFPRIFQFGRWNERLINGAKPSAIRAAVCGITIIRRVVQAHLSLGTLDTGEATAEFWTGTDAGAVSYELADLPEGIWDASLVCVWAWNNELATADGVHSWFGAFLSRKTLDLDKTPCQSDLGGGWRGMLTSNIGSPPHLLAQAILALFIHSHC